MRIDVDAKTLAAIHAHATELGVRLQDDATAVRWALCRGADIGLVVAPTAPPGVCQGCRKPRRQLWRLIDDAGVEWTAICDSCKVRILDPGRLAGTVLDAPIGEVIDTTGEAVDEAAPPQLPAGVVEERLG
jgi:hypothetical protein